MAKIKTHELRGKPSQQLLQQLEGLKNELSQLRVAKVAGGPASKLAKIKVIRKSVARVLTVYNQTQKDRMRELFKGRKHQHLDLRTKGTRSFRRRLSKDDAIKKTLRQEKKDSLFPKRKFAIRA